MRDDIFIPEHRTNVLPLRWLADYVFHPISMWFFKIALGANQKLEYDYPEATLFDELKEKIGFNIYSFFDKPYTWWGTTYVLNYNELDLDNLGGSGWDDYDENSHPYWFYTEWQEDPITGDAWKLKHKEGIK